jgi:hypothetical protein
VPFRASQLTGTCKRTPFRQPSHAGRTNEKNTRVNLTGCLLEVCTSCRTSSWCVVRFGRLEVGRRNRQRHLTLQPTFRIDGWSGNCWSIQKQPTACVLSVRILSSVQENANGERKMHDGVVWCPSSSTPLVASAPPLTSRFGGAGMANFCSVWGLSKAVLSAPFAGGLRRRMFGLAEPRRVQLSSSELYRRSRSRHTIATTE